ncbi:MAG: tRNA (adenosine(37)-N6)-dimethylallyltransferase MiaA [Spirochaetaceae bacterium]|jgi:tRNA dimethylallyltransferase|nr:tRNA (adenosine(37)-N6)-dimethylallyltransferase MiaA [Spirochaetaceae bacterium]
MGKTSLAACVFVLFGPTASGKTEILRRLFTGSGRICPAEIVSADSMQVYKGLDIGTAKPNSALLAELPHHLIDICSPSEQFNAGEFVRRAEIAIADIVQRGLLPVVSGGTGFYLKNLIEGLPESPPPDMSVRSALKTELEQKGADCLMQELQAVDPVSAERININDKYRLSRALEVFRSTGKPLSSYAASGRGDKEKYRFLCAGLEWERAALFKRIELRCKEMFRMGLADEVRALLQAGFTPDACPSLKAIGYNEFFVKKDDKYEVSDNTEAVEALVIRNSRRYAKRQITWFKKVQNVQWIHLEENSKAITNAVNTIAKILENE